MAVDGFPTNDLIDQFVFIQKITQNGTISDVMNAASRFSATEHGTIIAWIDSSFSFALAGAMAFVRLIHDLALTLFFAIAWPFSDASGNSCKVQLVRSFTNLAGIAHCVAGVVFPPLISPKSLLEFVSAIIMCFFDIAKKPLH